jgi:DNA-binding NarL/FixJ family response regulator
MTIRIVVADDQALVRAGFGHIIDSAADMTVVGEAGDGAEAVELAIAQHPDVLLMDIRMPKLDGLEATRRILASPDTRDVRILVLTTFDLDDYVFEALLAGASGFLLKDALPEELLAAIRTIAAGDALLAPHATRALINEFVRRPQRHPTTSTALEALTDRERDVLQLVAEGLSNAEIADQLVLSTGTVKTHMSHLLMKLSARDRAQLVATAYQTGFVRSQGGRA